MRTNIPILKEKLLPELPDYNKFKESDQKFKQLQKCNYDRRHAVRPLPPTVVSKKRLTFCNRSYGCNYDCNEGFTVKLQIVITKILHMRTYFRITAHVRSYSYFSYR